MVGVTNTVCIFCAGNLTVIIKLLLQLHVTTFNVWNKSDRENQNK